MREFLHELFDQFTDHWVKFVMAAVFTGVGWYFGKVRARREWSAKEFFDRLNISLNILQDHRLEIRTLSEGTCTDVFLNTVAVKTLINSARKTTPEDPFLPLPKDEYWHYLNAVLNEISQQFSQGQIQRDLGLPVTCATYLLCLTCENAGDMRTRKIRAMVIQKDQLLKLDDHVPQLSRKQHLTRWETLQTMAREYQSNPWKFLEVEICL